MSADATGETKRKRPRFLTATAVMLAIVAAYASSLFGVHALQTSDSPLPPLDLSAANPADTIVQVRLQKLKPVENRLEVDVLVHPGEALYDKRFDVLTTDLAVRLYPANDLGDLHYPEGDAPARVTTLIEAYGAPGNWPFDAYTTEELAADVFVGTGDDRIRIPARVEVTGALDGWDASVSRVHDASRTRNQRGDADAAVVVKIQRAKGPLIFDLAICLVLVSLPTLALWVAVPMALGKRKFLPPLGTWYAANLFAIIPLRNILPGAPPPGSWIDQAIVQWVLLALATAMSLFIYAWHRQGDD
ncbi:DUF4436 domain-containing protein [Mycolicibacter longobardus]|uniref:DUF4436 domain-containing protein n=1 Tax=Mycolicibacter longobardus TaxID=1108812 RepID=A0A1X1YS87_9MYCO|nr:hypothetical protein AWC16_03405 [Mycolicibacter longobardus]